MPQPTIKSYHFRNIFARSRPVVVLKAGKAAYAASIAFWVSVESNSGAVLITLPEEGSVEFCISRLDNQGGKFIPVTSNVFPD